MLRISYYVCFSITEKHNAVHAQFFFYFFFMYICFLAVWRKNESSQSYKTHTVHALSVHLIPSPSRIQTIYISPINLTQLASTMCSQHAKSEISYPPPGDTLPCAHCDPHSFKLPTNDFVSNYFTTYPNV